MADISVLNFGDGVNRNIKDVTSRVLLPSTVGWTGKNQFKGFGATSTSVTNQYITFTAIDGGVHLTGTSSGTYSQPSKTFSYPVELKGGVSYIFSIDDTRTTRDDIIAILNVNNVNVAFSRKGVTSTYTPSTDVTAYVIPCLNTSGVTVDDYLYPMVRDARITDPTYEPYHKSVEECKADNTVIAPVESGTTASQAYAQGAHFIRDGKFCTAITSIASGATLTKNTNYTEGDIASALSSGGSGGGEVYPSTETKIGTFLGVDLYRKVYKITSISSSFDTGISNAYYITRITGNITKGEAVYNLPHYASSSDRLSVYLQKGSFSDIYYKANFIQSIQDVSYVILIVEYTKENPYA